MSIASVISSMQTNLSNAYDKVNDKGGTLPANKNLQSLADAIDSISTGGGSEEKSVIIFTPYGEEIASYTPTEFASLSAYPIAPTLPNLTFREYNWALADAKTHVAKYGALVIGANYTTTSGYIEIVIELTPTTGLSQTVRFTTGKTIDWGDGTTETSTTQTSTHTYTNYGKYLIKVEGNATLFNPAFDQSSSAPNYTVKEIRFSTRDVEYPYSGIFQHCYSLEYMVLCPNYIPKSNSFSNCLSLKALILGNNASATQMPMRFAYYCKSLTILSMPKTIVTSGDGAVGYDIQLKYITFPDGLVTLTGNSFYYSFGIGSWLNGKFYIPASVTTSGSAISNECSINNITLYNTTIPNNMCQSRRLNKITIKGTSVTVGTSSFANTEGLREFVIDGTITSLGTSAFNGSLIKELTFPDGLTSIGDSAFNNCYALTKLDFSALTSVPSLGGTSAFNNCNKTLKIIVPDSLYTTWITTTNWDTYTNLIYKASDFA